MGFFCLLTKGIKMEIVDFFSILEYNESSPSCLIWKIKVNSNVFAGSAAGTQDKEGYWVIRYKGKGYKAHRVVMVLQGLEIKGKKVDHKDGNRSNNLKSNLRIASSAVNARNAIKNKNNTSGTTGVSRCKLKNHNYWCAIWYSTKINYKRFNIEKYGEQEAKRLAIEYRSAKIKELNNKGYGYSERHGK